VRASAGAGVASGQPDTMAWEELAIDVAATAIRAASALRHHGCAAPSDVAGRVTRSVRNIERNPGAPLTVNQLADEAGVSPFHYLRTFRETTGVTPHQFILRARLRTAATRLTRDDARVIDIALESGFGDVSNFNHAFRAEFGAAPETYRRLSR
jgi:AraC family transcriptional regulator